MFKLNLVDVTLRDGGYVNNWEFGHSNARNIIQLLQEANVNVIECGILGKTNNTESTMFNNLEDFKSILPPKVEGCKYAAMINFVGKDDFIITERKPDGIDIIRLAFFKEDFIQATFFAEHLIQLGYEVSLNAMAIHMYNRIELTNLIALVNIIKPTVFYMVDSFSAITQTDEFFAIINARLNDDIDFGIHCHNALQMANANTMNFILAGISMKRDIWVDTSIAGMGRGAGNAVTEVIMSNLNTSAVFEPQYDITKVIEIYEKYISKIYKEFPWGYTLKHYLCAVKEVNPAYIWYLDKNGITDLNEIQLILSEIPEYCKHYLNKEEINKIIEGKADE